MSAVPAYDGMGASGARTRAFAVRFPSIIFATRERDGPAEPYRVCTKI